MHTWYIHKLDDSAFFLTQSYITKICYFEFLPSLLFGWQKPYFPPVHITLLNLYPHFGHFLKRSTYLPQFTWKVDQNRNKVKFESVRTLLRITCLGHRKSNLVIICPNSHKKLIKSEIRSILSRFEHCSESLIYPIGSHIWSLLAPIHTKSWPKV